MVFPVTIGSGLRVFPETTRSAWTMTDTHTFPSGVRVDTYRGAGQRGGLMPQYAVLIYERVPADELPPR